MKSKYKDLLDEGMEIQSKLPLEQLRSAEIFIDRLNDNPEAPRHFLAFGDWSVLPQEEIFNNLDPVTKKNTLVYLDFPFCKTLCNFCAFYPVISRKQSDFETYLEGTRKEIDMLADLYFGPGDAEIETVELGGGTPTWTPLPLLQEVVDHLFEKFPVDPTKEHSFEGTPDSMAREGGFEKLRYLREKGFSRISLGVQSFDDTVLKSMNRSHRSEHVPTALKHIRDLQFDRINFDIMLGVPNQTADDFLSSVERAIDLGIEVLELYTMRYFDVRKHVPATRKLLRGANVAPPEEILAARIAADKMVRKAGYSSANGRTYQLGNVEYFSNYFLGNFRGDNLLGIGRKSHSNLYPFQYANYLNIEKYLSRLDQGRLPIGAGCRFGPDARLGKLLTGALQLPGGMDLPRMKGAVGAEASTLFDGIFQRFVDNDLLVEKSSGVYEKTFLGFMFVEELMKVVFDACVSPFTAESSFLGRSQTVAKVAESAA